MLCLPHPFVNNWWIITIKTLLLASTCPLSPCFLLFFLKKRQMGNCQAVDAATLAIQYPSGKVEKLYWPVSAAEVMKMNPGHYVALLLSTTLYPTHKNGECPNPTNNNSNNSVRITRIKLLKPTDTLVLGHVYRLITTQGLLISSFLWLCFVLRV